jgi:3-deoxy-D-manno-octulosonic-acid transferase
VLLASVRREEEEALCPALRMLMQQDRPLCVALAPRHMERTAFWAARLRELAGACGWRALSRSAMKAQENLTSKAVVLWDVFGELQALYARADAAFVGGSLAPLGGQNFMEASAAGVVPVIGPSWSNFAWVGREFFDAHLGIRISGAPELAPALLRQLELAETRDAVRARFHAYLAPRQGGARAMAEYLLALCSGAAT